MSASVRAALADGTIGTRLWFYANYHCNLACSYCLTESSPDSDRRILPAHSMVELAEQAAGLGFKSLGVTGGEPFMIPTMPDTLARLGEILPTVVLSNATLFVGPRLDRVVWAVSGRPVRIQISLDSPDAAVNDGKRGIDNWRVVSEAVPRLVARGVRVRIATTVDVIAPEDLERLCVLHRSWGIADEDHVVRPIVRRGRAASAGWGVEATVADLSPELTITADGAFWNPFGPTVRNGRIDTDLLLTRVVSPLVRPAEAMVRVASGQAPGRDTTLNIR